MHSCSCFVGFQRLANNRMDDSLPLILCRCSFQLRPNAELRNTNIRLLHAEALDYEVQVDEACRSLLSFAETAPPLWTKRNGLQRRSREQTHGVILQIATTGYFSFLALLLACLLPLYRFPSLVMQLRSRFHDRRAILLRGLAEYGRDALAFVQALLVYVTL